MAIPSIRLANMEDLEVVCDFAESFFDETPYAKSYVFSRRRVKEVIGGCLSSPVDKAVVILLESDTTPIGVLIAVAVQSIFSEDLLAQEIMWWVDPPYRGISSLKLLEALEEWAKEFGMSYVSMGSVPEVTKLDRLYTRLGYTNTELAYIKDMR